MLHGSPTCAIARSVDDEPPGPTLEPLLFVLGAEDRALVLAAPRARLAFAPDRGVADDRILLRAAARAEARDRHEPARIADERLRRVSADGLALVLDLAALADCRRLLLFAADGAEQRGAREKGTGADDQSAHRITLHDARDAGGAWAKRPVTASS